MMTSPSVLGRGGGGRMCVVGLGGWERGGGAGSGVGGSVGVGVGAGVGRRADGGLR